MLTISSNDLSNYFPAIIQIIYGRLDDASLSEAFKLRLVRFYHLVSALTEPERGYGADYFIAASNKVQDGAFVPLYLKVILPLTRQLVKPLDRKAAAISLTKTIANSERFANRYAKGWTLTCETLIVLLENAPVIAADDAAVVEQDVDDLAFGVGFTQLNTCRRQPRDLWPEIKDVRSWVGQYYKSSTFVAADGSKPADWLSTRLSPEVGQKFVEYLRM
jgi:exportin-2 (importin alpha re-exporter)